MSRVRPTTSTILTLLSLLAIALSWHSIYRSHRLPEELAEAYRQRVFPKPILGLKLPLLEETRSVDGNALPASYPRTALVLVSSVTCSKSQANQPRWKQLVDTLSDGRVDEVWVVGFRDDAYLAELADYLAADTAIPFRVLRARDRATFGLRTGLSAVPDTLVLDDQGRIAMNLVGILSLEDIELVRLTLQGRSAASPLTQASVHRS